jgi:hypothetical protein
MSNGGEGTYPAIDRLVGNAKRMRGTPNGGEVHQTEARYTKRRRDTCQTVVRNFFSSGKTGLAVRRQMRRARVHAMQFTNQCETPTQNRNEYTKQYVHKTKPRDMTNDSKVLLFFW